MSEGLGSRGHRPSVLQGISTCPLYWTWICNVSTHANSSQVATMATLVQSQVAFSGFFNCEIYIFFLLEDLGCMNVNPLRCFDSIITAVLSIHVFIAALGLFRPHFSLSWKFLLLIFLWLSSMLCGQFMNNFDRAMNLLDEKYNFLSSSKQIVSFTSETDKVGLMFFNPFFHFWENFWFLCSSNLEIFQLSPLQNQASIPFRNFCLLLW